MHILVVEDEQRLAYLLRRVLLEERHTVDLADSRVAVGGFRHAARPLHR